MATEAEKLLSTREVIDRIGLSRATLGRLVKRGDFPQPIRVTPQILRWPESVVAGWIQAKQETPLDVG